MSDTSKAPPTDINFADLASLVAGLSRFLNSLSQMPHFEQAELGFAEWTALSVAAKKPLTGVQLAKTLGVSKQRVSQIVESLRGDALIEFTSLSGDARKKLISVTTEGKSRMEKLEHHLKPVVASALGGRPLVLSRASRMINGPLMTIVKTEQEKLKQKLMTTKA